MTNNEVFIVAAARTPIGKKGNSNYASFYQ